MADMLKYNTTVMDDVAQKLRSLGSELTSCSTAVSRLASRVDRASGSEVRMHHYARMNMAGMSVSSDDVTQCLRQYARVLSKYQEISSQLGKNVRSASQLFVDTERELAGLSSDLGTGSAHVTGAGGASAGAIWNGLGVIGATLVATEEKKPYDWKGLLLKIIGKAGTAGSIFSALLGLNPASPSTLLNYIVKGGDVAVKWAKGIFNDSQSVGDFAKELFGLNKYLKTPSTATGWAAFTENFGNAFKTGLSKPVSWITAGISSFVSNYNEFGGKLTDRAVVEWAVETGTTVVVGAASTAAVGAALAAAGVAAPALAVGAAGVVVYAAADAVWANTLGNGKGIVESVGHVAGEAYEGAKAVVSGAADWLGEKVSNLKKGFTIKALWA